MTHVALEDAPRCFWHFDSERLLDLNRPFSGAATHPRRVPGALAPTQGSSSSLQRNVTKNIHMPDTCVNGATLVGNSPASSHSQRLEDLPCFHAATIGPPSTATSVNSTWWRGFNSRLILAPSGTTLVLHSARR